MAQQGDLLEQLLLQLVYAQGLFLGGVDGSRLLEVIWIF